MHCISLHYTLHYITLPYLTFHYITLQTYIHIYIYICAYTCIYIYICVCVYVYINLYIYMCVCFMYLYTNVFVCTFVCLPCVAPQASTIACIEDPWAPLTSQCRPMASASTRTTVFGRHSRPGCGYSPERETTRVYSSTGWHYPKSTGSSFFPVKCPFAGHIGLVKDGESKPANQGWPDCEKLGCPRLL